MPDKTAPLRISFAPGLADIAPHAWDALSQKTPFKTNDVKEASESRTDKPVSSCKSGKLHLQEQDEQPEDNRPPAEAPDNRVAEDTQNPFLTHAFLSALEASGSVGGRTGWTPLHIIARDGEGVLKGAIPAYAKSHSRGEYVFDHAFAEAYARAGGDYYPKIQVSIPFTPATGRRILAESDETRAALIGGLEELRGRIGASSTHATFVIPEDRGSLAKAGYLTRHDQQFHFINPGYRDFDDYLSVLASRKRKAMKRERREALENGITIEWLTGSAITEAHWDAFFTFYMDTGARKWGTPYLTRAFFSRVGASMADKILLIMARREGRFIAGALNVIGANTLYGRNWGAIEHHPFLHFEVCYYQAIEFAIEHKLARVEAGAQGEHKLARGYGPVKTTSMHRFAEPGFHRAVAAYLAREREAVEAAQAELMALTPFRKL